MTPEEIKKIAEEYGNHRSSLDKQLAAIFATDGRNFLTWLTARFYLVEKGKVEEAYNDFENDGFYVAEYDNKILNDYDVEAYFVSLFGPDIRKEEEDA